MSIARTVSLWCDHDECANAHSFVQGSGDFRTAQAVRAKAKTQGWSHVDGKDLCAHHTAWRTAG